MNSRQLLSEQAARWGIRLDAAQHESLMRYAGLLEHYEAANVIGTREHRRVVTDHIVDSLSCLLTGLMAESRSLVDIGAGGGLPGIPLKVSTPHIELDLIESTRKKARFLEYAAETLNLQKTRVLNGRVEEYGRPADYRARYDIATVRAVAQLAVITEYSLPLLKVGGHVIAMKARLGEEEIEGGRAAAKLLGARVEEVLEVSHIRGIGERERRLVIIKKVSPTPDKYPRQTGVAKSRPLGARKA